MSFREADKMTSQGGDPKPSILKAYIAVFPRRLEKNILSARQKSVVRVRGGGGTRTETLVGEQRSALWVPLVSSRPFVPLAAQSA